MKSEAIYKGKSPEKFFGQYASSQSVQDKGL